MNLNTHSTRIPQEIIDQAKAKLAEALELLKPYMITLTNDQRVEMLKMGDKSMPFVTDANNFAAQSPQFLPAFTTKEEFDIDFTDALGLKGLQLSADQLATAISDTVMIAGSEAYYAALGYYNNAALGAKQNVPGAKDIYDALKKRFPGISRKNKKE